MAQHRKALFDLLRPRLKLTQELVDAIDGWCDRAGVAKDAAVGGGGLAAAGAAAACTGPLQGVADLQARLGVDGGGRFGVTSVEALNARLSNRNAPALVEADFERVAAALQVPVKLVKGVRTVEAPRGAYDDEGRPTILFERHKFRKHSGGRFDRSHPHLSNAAAGGYGKYGEQYGKLAQACALDPEAAFKACSWGAFQVLGENAEPLGYASAFDMALELTKSEAAHLDSFVRFVRTNGLVDELRACRAGNPDSCIPFVERYNGPAFRRNNYHVKLAEAAR